MKSIVRESYVLSYVRHACLYGPGYWNCTDGRFVTVKVLVLKCINVCNLITIHHFFQKIRRYMDAYRYARTPHTHRLDNATFRKGLNMCQAAFVNKLYKSHQRIGLPSDLIESLATQDEYKTL